MNDAQSIDRSNEIAIIGLACRLPGARNLDEFWNNLSHGVESITFFTDQELLAAGMDSAVIEAPNYVSARPILPDIDLFDAEFFKVSPREAALIDPQQRVFLECAAEALENASCNPESFQGRIGLYAGSEWNTYFLHNVATDHDLLAEPGNALLLATADKDYLTTRVSYKLNLKGPSVAVQTACSTSLVAVHLACDSLLNRECDIALAGAVAINIPQQAGYLYEEKSVLSPDGHCRPFDAEAKGTVFGSGIGIVVLKRLDDAQTNGDAIWAVIKGSAVNNDGAAKIGYTAPSLEGQAAVIAEALEVAGVHPDRIAYVEAHGTATELGDPIEIAALTKAFRVHTEKSGFCAIGSVKGNFGHLGVASGVTGLIKTVLALKNRFIPPSLYFHRPNSMIDFANSPFFVNTELRPWPTDGRSCAGVSSFGIGGTNAHLILEEYPQRPVADQEPGPQLLLLSAKTEDALEKATSNLAEHLRDRPTANLADIAYTLQVGRTTFDVRRMAVCSSSLDAAEVLARRTKGRVYTAKQTAPGRPIAFLFPGVGDHYGAMAQGIYEAQPTFRRWFDHCSDLLMPLLQRDLRRVLYPGRDEGVMTTAPAKLHPRNILARQSDFAQAPPDDSLLETALVQPTVFVVEYSLAKLLETWGIRPQAMLGYSLGEYVAACLAGVLSLENALVLVARRAQMISSLPTGAMLTVPLSPADVRPLLGEEVVLTGLLTPTLSVLAGPPAAITAVGQQLAAQGIASRLLPTTHAFHSLALLPAQASFVRFVQTLDLKPPQIPFLSNVTGEWISAEEAADPAYWGRHLCQPVQFSAAAGRLVRQLAGTVILEVGPGQSLGSFVRQHPDYHAAGSPPVLPTIRYAYEEQADEAFLLTTLGKLWLEKVEIDWARVHGSGRRQRVPLPTYPFARHRHWIEPQPDPMSARVRRHPTGKTKNPYHWFYRTTWALTLPRQRAESASLPPKKPLWLVFATADSIATELLRQLACLESPMAIVTAGEGFAELGDRAFVINPDHEDDYIRLVRALAVPPQRILHLWTLTPGSVGVLDSQVFAEAQRVGFYSLLYLSKALGKQTVPEDVKLWVVTRNVYRVTGVERLAPQYGSLTGACKVVAQEYLNIVCHHIDIDDPPPASWQERVLAGSLSAELVAESSEATTVYRGNERWIQNFEPIPLEPALRTVPLRKRGVYLLVGGLGSIGSIISEHLAQTLNARLVIITHTPFPTQDEWDVWLDGHDPQDRISRRIRTVRCLEAMGSEVLVVRADISDELQLREAVNRAQARFGEIHGVVYAAGFSDDNKLLSIQDTARLNCEAHFDVKARGLFTLEKVLADKQIEFCMLFSSLSSILGGLGFIAYSAANSFMDAFTHRHNDIYPVRWLCVNWDSWETGDGLRDARTPAVLQYAMKKEEALQAFERALSLAPAVTQVINATGDFQVRFDRWVRLQGLRAKGAAKPARPAAMTFHSAPLNGTERIVAAAWQEVLGVSPGAHDNFYELGGHSLVGMQIMTRLCRTFETSLPWTLILESPTVAEMAAAIELAIIEEIDKLDEGEAVRRVQSTS